jgi:hypothetical protein
MASYTAVLSTGSGEIDQPTKAVTSFAVGVFMSPRARVLSQFTSGHYGQSEAMAIHNPFGEQGSGSAPPVHGETDPTSSSARARVRAHVESQLETPPSANAVPPARISKTGEPQGLCAREDNRPQSGLERHQRERN